MNFSLIERNNVFYDTYYCANQKIQALTDTSSYSISDKFLLRLTVWIFSLDGSTLAHLSISTRRCSLTTLACAFLIVMTAPSLMVSSCPSQAMSLTQPVASPTIHSAARLISRPSLRTRLFTRRTYYTRRCIVTRVPGSTSSIVTNRGFERVGLFAALAASTIF